MQDVAQIRAHEALETALLRRMDSAESRGLRGMLVGTVAGGDDGPVELRAKIDRSGRA